MSQPSETTEAVTAADTATSDGDGTYVPPMLLVVFGLPILLTLVWFFLQFTRPDRFGRVDAESLGEPEGPDPAVPGIDTDVDDAIDDHRR